jgi:hypothetical protein
MSDPTDRSMPLGGSATVEWSRTALTALVAVWVVAGGRLDGAPRERLAPHMDPA